MKSIILKSGRDESAQRRHPWIFSGAIKKADGDPANGETVELYGADGTWLARGAYCGHSQIRVRIWSWDSAETIDARFFAGRLERAYQARRELIARQGLSAFRLIYGESDGLPGLIVDQYDRFLVCQFLSAGAEYWKPEIVQALRQMPGVAGIFERSDADVRLKEGLEKISGPLWGEEPPDLVAIREGDLQFWVDLRKGHKTGFYLDQRENRLALREFCPGAEVLNCFAYTGGFGVAALRGGANQVVNIDTSREALDLALRNTVLNDLPEARLVNEAEDVFVALRKYRDTGRQFDLVVLDPPKFVHSAGQLQRGCRGYKDINLLALKLLRPGGILFTFSCSGHVEPRLFQKIVADAALDAGRDLQIIRFLGQAADHPVAAAFPESQYLKGIIGRVS
ncbi:MAG: 23S rRNA (cytosine(1962)-C(5))-methyltransferase RlmI [Desulfobacteraceae bacterium]|nr:MAG: 23S rRNA (cytosine(1962)-C(5))-methyltransferase RlmI [Desulfobacteraceae bacterium]